MSRKRFSEVEVKQEADEDFEIIEPKSKVYRLIPDKVKTEDVEKQQTPSASGSVSPRTENGSSISAEVRCPLLLGSLLSNSSKEDQTVVRAAVKRLMNRAIPLCYDNVDKLSESDDPVLKVIGDLGRGLMEMMDAMREPKKFHVETPAGAVTRDISVKFLPNNFLKSKHTFVPELDGERKIDVNKTLSKMGGKIQSLKKCAQEVAEFWVSALMDDDTRAQYSMSAQCQAPNKPFPNIYAYSVVDITDGVFKPVDNSAKKEIADIDFVFSVVFRRHIDYLFHTQRKILKEGKSKMRLKRGAIYADEED